MKVTNLMGVDLSELQKLHEQLANVFNHVVDGAGTLNESVSAVDGDLEQQIAELSRRFEASRKGLSIAHRLANGPEKQEHMSRILTNMNVIRGMLSRVIKQVSQFARAENSYNEF